MAFVTDTDLAATGAGQGANMVGSLQAGTDAVMRTAQDELRDFVKPEQFGAVGDGTTDDTEALQAALDTGRSVVLREGGSYLLKRKLLTTANGVRISGKATIKIAADFDIDADSDGTGPVMRAFFISGAHCTFEGVTFDCTLSPVGAGRTSACLWVEAEAFKALGCTFIEHPKGAAIVGKQFGTWLVVNACHFYNCTGAIFTQARSCNFTGNVIIDCTDAAIALNGADCAGAVVAGNSISNEAAGEIPAMIAIEEGASRWAITGNTLLGVKGGGIVCFNSGYLTTVKGGVISGNMVTGARFDGNVPTTTNPATLLNVSEYYADWIVADNILTMPPTGSSGTRIALIAATGGVFANNVIDGTNFSGGTAVEIAGADGKGLVYRDNLSRMGTPARHLLFSGGDYQSGRVSLQGGRFLGGSTGIDSDTNWGVISNLAVEILNISESTVSPTLCAMTSYFGDRATFLNGGAWARPHRLGTFTDMYAVALPTTPGALAFVVGDTFQYLSPAGPGYKGVVRVAGSFMSFGALV